MLTFLFLVVCDSFGWLTFRLAAEAWTLLQIGMGGYVIGRSCEKVLPQILKNKQTDQYKTLSRLFYCSDIID